MSGPVLPPIPGAYFNGLPDESGASPMSSQGDPGGSVTVGPFTVRTTPDLIAPPTPVVIQQGNYFDYACSKVIFDESGYAVNTVQGGPDTPNDVIRPYSPSGWMVVRWVSRRRGAMPLIPSRDLGPDANAVYIRGWIAAAVPGHLLSGAQCHQVEGCYIYQLRKPYKESDSLVIGAMPYSDEEPSENTLSPGQFQKDIVGPNVPPAGAPSDPLTF